SFMSSSTLLLSAYIPRPPISTFFPYTTLFRSTVGVAAVGKQPVHQLGCGRLVGRGHRRQRGGVGTRQQCGRHGQREGQQESGNRSEEHTSELQSRENLVCRLLLEKKK